MQHKFELQSDLLGCREGELEKLKEELEGLTNTAQRLQRQLRDANFKVSSLTEQLQNHKSEKLVCFV